MNNDESKYLIDAENPLQKNAIIFTMKCSDSKESLDAAIEYFTNGKVSLKDYKGDYSYEDLYNFVVEHGDAKYPWRKRKINDDEKQ